jgi:hypothetical protein
LKKTEDFFMVHLNIGELLLFQVNSCVSIVED